MPAFTSAVKSFFRNKQELDQPAKTLLPTNLSPDDLQDHELQLRLFRMTTLLLQYLPAEVEMNPSITNTQTTSTSDEREEFRLSRSLATVSSFDLKSVDRKSVV